MQDKFLFSTYDNFLSIKKCEHLNYYYMERRGIDSIAIIFVDINKKEVGISNFPKPPFSERDDVEIPLKTSAFVSGLSEIVDKDIYINLSFKEQLNLCKQVALNQIQSKVNLTLDINKVEFVNRLIFNYMTNEYVWLFVYETNKIDVLKNQKDLILWYNIKDLNLIEDAKTKVILFDYLINKNLITF